MLPRNDTGKNVLYICPEGASVCVATLSKCMVACAYRKNERNEPMKWQIVFIRLWRGAAGASNPPYGHHGIWLPTFHKGHYRLYAIVGRECLHGKLRADALSMVSILRIYTMYLKYNLY